MTEKTNTAIVGAGPAGVTAAIQLKRSGIDHVLFERDRIGGLLANANLVENFPGFPTGVTGRRLIRAFSEHLAELNIELTNESVVRADHEGGFFHIRTDSSRHIRSENLIIASGTVPRKWDLGGGAIGLFDRIFSEVVPLLDEKDKVVAIIGAGDAALDYALNLSRKNRVVLLNRSVGTKCLPLLFRRAERSENIEYRESAEVTRVERGDSSLKLTVEIRGAKEEIEVDHLITAIGRVPATDFLGPKMRKGFKGKIDIPGLYFAGDVVRGITRQASIAVGDGMYCAMDIYARQRGWTNADP